MSNCEIEDEGGDEQLTPSAKKQSISSTSAVEQLASRRISTLELYRQ